MPSLTPAIAGATIPASRAWQFACFVAFNLIEVFPKRVHLEFIVTVAESWLASHPDNSGFWMEQGIGTQLCALIDAIRGEQSPFLEAAPSLRDRVHRVLSILVGLGVAEAARLEQTSATDADE